MTWRRTRVVNTPDAYWSYLDRYPRGPHAVDARRRLASLTEPEEPPPSFSPIGYDIPPPPPAEIVYVDRPLLVFDDPEFGFVPPPPIVFLAPPPPYLVFLPPPPPFELFVLPVPVFVPFPVWINSPAYVVAPPGNAIFKNIHNTTIINNKGPVINPGSPNPYPASGLPTAAGVGAGVAAAAIAAKVALPPSVAKKATIIGGSNSGLPEKTPGQLAPGAPPGQPGALPKTGLPPGHALPGANGKLLPGPGEKPVGPAQQKLQPALPGALQNPPGAPSPNKPPAVHALPSGQHLPPLPSGHVAPGGAKPGAKGKPLPGPSETPVAPTQQKPQPAAPGAPSPNKPTAVHALPSGQQLPPSPGGHVAPGGAKPGRITPPGALPLPGRQPPNKPPVGQLSPQNGRAPSGSNGKPAVTGPSPAIVPKPQQPHQPQPAYQPPRPPPQPAYQPPRPPPQPAYQPPRPPPQPAYQPPRPPPQQQKPTCGLPGLPPCH
jgi:hypothetical protein